MISPTGKVWSQDDGISLLDVLAAAVMTGMVLVVVMQIVVVALGSARTAEQRGLALLVGTSTLAEYQAGALRDTSGQYPKLGEAKLTWHVQETATSDEKLQVVVKWRERYRDAELTLPSGFSATR